EAATAYERATELAPTNYLYWTNLGDAYRWMPGAEQRARTAFERAITLATDELKLNPREATVNSRVAMCYAKIGRHAEAKRHIDTALSIDGANAGFLYKAAVIANLRG